jgi:hypothetical protein
MANYSVLLETLDCKILEKDTGNNSEIYFNYIIDNGSVKRFPLSGNFSINKGNVWDINLQLSFNSKLVVVLIEVDSLSGENDLGIITINNSLCSGKGSFANKNKGYYYELTFCLLPLFSVELANLECLKNTTCEEGFSNIYLKYKIDNGKELRYPTTGNLTSEKGECCYLGLNLQFYDKIYIYLMESVAPTHKVLGMIQLNSSILNGFQHFTNENADWDFKIIYFGLNHAVNAIKPVSAKELVFL